MDVKELQAMLEKHPDLADVLTKAYAKAEARAKADKLRKAVEPLRKAAQTLVSKEFEPGWTGKIVIEIGDFATSPEVRILQRFERDHKTSYRRIFATAITKNGKRGGEVAVIDQNHKLAGKIFKNTGELAKALGLPENSHGPYNALRSAGYHKNKFWAYVADLDQPNN